MYHPRLVKRRYWSSSVSFRAVRPGVIVRNSGFHGKRSDPKDIREEADAGAETEKFVGGEFCVEQNHASDSDDRRRLMSAPGFEGTKSSAVWRPCFDS